MRISKCNQMRIAIATDVLYQLVLGALVSTPGTYLNFRESWGDNTLDILKDLSSKKRKTIPACDVCALGAVFVCATKLYNDVPEPRFGYLDDQDMRQRMLEFFDMHELREIEAFFENWRGQAPWIWLGSSRYTWDVGPGDVDPTNRDVLDDGDDALNRLVAVMSSIVANNGKLDWKDPMLSEDEDEDEDLW